MPKQTLRAQVSSLDVARYYIKSELGHIFPDVNVVENLAPRIDQMPDSEIWALGDSLSTHYRLNSVWWVVADPNFEWSQELLSVGKVRLTGLGDTPINDLIYSEEIKNDPMKLKQFLQDYYAKNLDDPNHYSVKPTSKEISYPEIMVFEDSGALKLLDGSHRFIEQLLRNYEKVNAYVARPKKSSKLLPMIGEGIFRSMIHTYKNLDSPSEEKQVLSAAKILSMRALGPDPIQHFEAIQKKKALKSELKNV